MFLIKDVPVGRLNALVKKIGGLSVMDGILDGTVKFVVEIVKSVINIIDFFKTRDGLWLSGDFQKRILAPALEMPETAPASIGDPYGLSMSMTDAEILEKLGHKVFENSRAFLNTLARLIDEQWGGTEGALLNNGYANIFYVRGVNGKGESEVFAVVADWAADYGKWNVFMYRLDDKAWPPGNRAFPTN